MKPNNQVKPVAVLCCSGRSIYKHMPGVIAFDKANDARQFAGHNPVVAHPPCRTWSKYLAHLAKPTDREAERDLGKFCVEKVIANGGVLEQPAHSGLWLACRLPWPGCSQDPWIYTIWLEQSWFGYATPKPTWLLISGVPKNQLPPVPFSLAKQSGPNSSLSSAGRSRTIQPLAEWLCEVARRSWWQLK